MGGTTTPTNIINEYQATANSAHIHRRLGELWSVSVDQSVTSGNVLDVVIDNPTGSGNLVEVVLWGIGIDGEAKVTQYRDTGLYSGSATAITPRNFDGRIADGSQDFNAEFAKGASPQLVDTGSDTRFDGGVHSTSSVGRISSTASRRPELDTVIPEGNDYAIHIEADAAVNPIASITVAEYDPTLDPTERI